MLLCFIISIILFTVITKRVPYQFQFYFSEILESQENILDGCQYVYIDLGTNIGIQIRKLYEPHLYPDALVLPLFRQLFGNHTDEVCSVGFEANPVHTDYLKEFENYCLQRNWRVKIFTELSVSTRNGNLTFYTEPGNEGHNQWGASLEKTLSSQKGNVTVPSIDIVAWYKNTVLTRKIPLESKESRVMMKHDLEGHDSTVMIDFVLRGMYCTIDLVYGEHLPEPFQDSISQTLQYSKSCQTKYLDMDDESYYTVRLPFAIPESKNTNATT